MGIWMFIFYNDHWKDIYSKNCSLKSQEEWYSAGYASLPLGLLYSTFGLICELIYVPFLLAMLKKEFIQFSCYKFMFLIGVIDLFVIPCNAIITGMQTILGAHFCTHPEFFFWVGSIGTSGWYSVSLTCLILAVDRFLIMCWPKAAEAVFGGKVVYIWLMLPIFYMFYTFLNVPFIYNTKRFAYFTDPFVGIHGMEGNPAFFKLTFHCIHNIGVAFLLAGIYSSLLIVMKIRSRVQKNVAVSKQQKILTLQAICICIEIFVAALVYVYNQFLPLPNILEIIAHVSWIGIHEDTPIVYLLLNKSLRSAVFQLIKGKMSTVDNLASLKNIARPSTPARQNLNNIQLCI